MSETANQRVAIVTGASRGIGRATAVELAGRGYRVALVARTRADLQGTADLIAAPTRTMVIVADLTDPASSDHIVTTALKQFGRIDVLVNNAGVAPMRSVADTTPTVWRDTIETNLSAAFYLTRACWPTFETQGGGVVINVSSLSAVDPFAGFFAYGAAKAGLNTLGLALARDGAARGIRVHTFALGATETEMFRSLPGMADYPKANVMDPADVARTLAACADGDASRASGEVITLVKEV